MKHFAFQAVEDDKKYDDTRNFPLIFHTSESSKIMRFVTPVWRQVTYTTMKSYRLCCVVRICRIVSRSQDLYFVTFPYGHNNRFTCFFPQLQGHNIKEYDVNRCSIPCRTRFLRPIGPLVAGSTGSSNEVAGRKLPALQMTMT